MIFGLLIGFGLVILGGFALPYWAVNAKSLLYEYLGITCGECFSEWSCTAWILIGYLSYISILLAGIAIIYSQCRVVEM